MSYLINKNANTSFVAHGKEVASIKIDMFKQALKDTHKTIRKITTDIPVDIFSILGMRNLSAFIGEIYAHSIAKKSAGMFISNPHQDGYPDLLLMNKSGKAAYKQFKKEGKLRDKTPFSPFLNGGLEIKATCGSVPTPKECAKKGQEKPDMGETRINLAKGYDWKAHHRETNNLIGIYWDFQDGIPQIMAVFFSTDLTETDWGKIVQPKDGGGRTTSVSIMTRAGVKKMYSNWIAVKNDSRYIDFFNKYNGDKIIYNKAR